MDILQKIVKVTQQQYDTLKNGGTVGGYTGLNSNYIYLVQEDGAVTPPDEYLPLSGGTINAGGTKAPLILKGGTNNHREGLRIIPSNSWSTIVLGGNDIGESQGTSANSWSILNYNGSFFISKNGADGATVKLSNTDGTWKVNNNTIIHSGNIGSQSVSYATTAGTANSVALKASSGGATKATMQYNSTEDCIEFIFA